MQDIRACSRAAHANAWTDGRVIAFTQSDWGSGGSAAGTITQNGV